MVTRRDYTEEAVEAARSVLVEVLHLLGEYRDNIVLVGELWCELDGGVEVRLQAGDCLVQCGTRHAWRNKGSETCIKVAIMVGAVRA